MENQVRDVGGGEVPAEAATVIWRAAFDLLPVEEPAGDGLARWKIERGENWFICERQANADEHTARIAFVVDAAVIAVWIAPLRNKAKREGDVKLERLLAMVRASLHAADDGFRAFELAIQGRHVDG